ncbi:hypothetical protein MNBD_GAMMA07-1354 [hydrothermal vent metagenome]|uniref:Outer membrane protein beta-barrel domain-containing protein n=1 Tax=hydrothermal vent metagenome TaxID=652676 RepID=A0A3B0X320_9ZZZZ
MNALKYLNLLFLLTLLVSTQTFAESYFSLGVGQIKVDTDGGATKPFVADFRIGYEFDVHQFEVAIMSSVKDDSLNSLTVDVPLVSSVFYRYSPYQAGSIKTHLILGYSQVDVDSTFPSAPDASEQFTGGSYGIGFEESFNSIRNLKIKVELMQLYRGDQLNINLFSLGLRYVF